MHDKQYLDMMNQWLILKQEEKSIARYLLKKGYYSVAIYGMALYGRHVVRELAGTDVNIAYGIDRKKMEPYRGIRILQPLESLSQVNAVINTVIYDHSAIQKTLATITDAPVLSLEDVIYESYDQ